MENNFFPDELPPWPEMDLTWPEMDLTWTNDQGNLTWTNNSRITAIKQHNNRGITGEKQADNSEITEKNSAIANYSTTLCARYSNITTRDIALSTARVQSIPLSVTRDMLLSTARVQMCKQELTNM
jgi:hypothetical protein